MGAQRRLRRLRFGWGEELASAGSVLNTAVRWISAGLSAVAGIDFTKQHQVLDDGEPALRARPSHASINTFMLINEVTNPLKTFLAQIKAGGMTVRTTIDADNMSQARAILQCSASAPLRQFGAFA